MARSEPDSKTPLISVIIPIYKVEQYLPRCLDSLLAQTYRAFHIVLVDDGSPDNCGAICDEYAARDSRIRVIHKENGGVSSARNAGLDHVFQEGPRDFIAFIDSDDWLHPQYFELLIGLAEKTEADIAVCNFLKVSEADKAYMTEPLPADLQMNVLDVGTALSTPGVKQYIWGRIYRSCLLEQKRFEQTLTFKEDTLFNLDVICGKQNMVIAFTNAQLYYYLQRKGSLVHSVDVSQFSEMANQYYSRVGQGEGSQSDTIRLLECIKALLSCRYSSVVLAGSTTAKGYRPQIRQCLKLMSIHSDISIKEKLIYQILGTFPFVYRLFRIIGDPTLLSWERANRNHRIRQEH